MEEPVLEPVSSPVVPIKCNDHKYSESVRNLDRLHILHISADDLRKYHSHVLCKRMNSGHIGGVQIHRQGEARELMHALLIPLKLDVSG